MKLIRAAFASAAILGLVVGAAYAQQQDNLDLGQLNTNAGSYTTAGTYNVQPTPNTTGRGVMCQWNQLSSSGTATATFAVQSQDAASGVWNTLTSTGLPLTVTSVTNGLIQIYPGITAPTSVSTTTWAVGSVHLPRTWRVQIVIGGTGGPAFNYNLGCNLLQ